MEAALDPVRPGTAAVAAGARHGAVRAADGREALVVQRVVRNVVLGDVAPHVLLAPIGERGGLPLAVGRVPAELGGVRARGGLVAPQPGDPGVHLVERPLERPDLAHPAAGVGIRRPQALDLLAGVAVDRDPVALLDAPPRLVRLVEQHARVEHEEARGRLHLDQHVQDHRRLLLEGAGDVQARVELAHHVLEDLLGAERLEIWGAGRGGHEPDSLERGPVLPHSVVTARSTSTLAARRAGWIAASTPAIDARMTTAIRVPTGSSNTKPSSASGRETIAANAIPSTMPSTAPIAAVITDSARTIRRTWRRDMPTARRSPSSRVRSCTDRASVLTMPSSATITDSDSSAYTSPTSVFTCSFCSSLKPSIVCGLAAGKPARAVSSPRLTASGSSPATSTNA